MGKGKSEPLILRSGQKMTNFFVKKNLTQNLTFEPSWFKICLSTKLIKQSEQILNHDEISKIRNKK